MVLRALARGFHELENFDENAYGTCAPFDVSLLEARIDDERWW